MEKYNSIDDALEVPEINAKLPEDVKKEKHYNPFYSPLTNLGLIAALLLTGCVATPRASAQDTKQSYGTEQTVKQEIDLSQYTKVAEEDGLEVYVNPIRRNVRNWDNIVDKDFVKKWINYTTFWDTIILNTTDYDITLNKRISESLTGKQLHKEIEGEKFLKAYTKFSPNPDKVIISARNYIKFEDETYTTGDKNKILQETFFGTNELNQQVKITYKIKVN